MIEPWDGERGSASCQGVWEIRWIRRTKGKPGAGLGSIIRLALHRELSTSHHLHVWVKTRMEPPTHEEQHSKLPSICESRNRHLHYTADHVHRESEAVKNMSRICRLGITRRKYKDTRP